LAASARHVLVTAKRSPSFFGSLVGALSLAQALIAALVARGGGEAIAALGETERHLDAFDTYWEGASTRRARR
jgi:DNA-binding MurR/RpiR family transcriptional regulator